MTLIKKMILSITVNIAFAFGTDYPHESQSPLMGFHHAALITDIQNVYEKASPLIQEVGRSVYNNRYIILTASLAYIAVTELPMSVVAFPFINYCQFDPILEISCKLGSFGFEHAYKMCCYSGGQ